MPDQVNESSYLDISRDDQQPSKDQITSLNASPNVKATILEEVKTEPQLGLKILLNKRGEKVVRLELDDGRTLFVNLKKLTQHKAKLVDTQ